MAPQNRKRSVNKKRDRKHVQFSKRNDSIPSTNMSVSTTNSEPTDKRKPIPDATNTCVWENKILHYLRKLKNYWRSTPSVASTVVIPAHSEGCRENVKERFERYNADNRKERVNRNVMKPMLPCPDKYSSKNREILERRSSISTQQLEQLCTGSRKAQDVVAAAIEYGLVNGIVSRNGEYFWLKKEKKLSRRSLTPGIALRKKGHCDKAIPRKSAYAEQENKENCVVNKNSYSVRSGPTQLNGPSHRRSAVLLPPKTKSEPLNAKLKRKIVVRKGVEFQARRKNNDQTRGKRKSPPIKIIRDKKRPRRSAGSYTTAYTSSTADLDSVTPPPKKKCKCKRCKGKKLWK